MIRGFGTTDKFFLSGIKIEGSELAQRWGNNIVPAQGNKIMELL